MSIIRPWSLSDAPHIAQAINNKKLLDNLRDGLPFPYTQEDARAYIQATLDAPADSQYVWAIVQGDKAIGSIGLFRQGNIHRHSAELGYYIGEDHWGKGMMSQAVKEVCAFAWAQTDLLRIYAEPFSENKASCRVLEKAGFVCEGTLRNHAVKNGRIIDMRLYSLVRDSFRQ